MNWPTRVLAVLLRWLAGPLPADRREWARALWSEAAEVPAGWPRMAWLAGGVWLTAREATLGRGLGYLLAFAAAIAGTAWSAWSGPAGDLSIVINRVDVITMVVILAGLPWAIRRTCGSVAVSRLARLVRTGGYTAIFALVLVKSAVERVADAPPNSFQGPARWMGEVAFLAVMGGYAAVDPGLYGAAVAVVLVTVAIGTNIGAVIGVVAYALGPLGFPLRFTGSAPARLYDAAMALGVLLALCAPMAAGLAAARRSGCSVAVGAQARRGAMAGLYTAAAAALVVAVLSTATIALLPRDTALHGLGIWPYRPMDADRGTLDPDLRSAQLPRLCRGQQRLLRLATWSCSCSAPSSAAPSAPGPPGSRRATDLPVYGGQAASRQGQDPSERLRLGYQERHGRASKYGAVGPCWLAPLVSGRALCWSAASFRRGAWDTLRAPDRAGPARPCRRFSDHCLARRPSRPGGLACCSRLPASGRGAERGHRRRLPDHWPA